MERSLAFSPLSPVPRRRLQPKRSASDLGPLVQLYQSLSVTLLGEHKHMAVRQSAPDLRSMDHAELLIPAKRVVPHASALKTQIFLGHTK